MKLLVATVALATLITSPAFAQYGVWRGTYRAYATPYQAFSNPYRAYASPYYVSRSPFAVYDLSGHYIGQDPDARVRSQLARDPSQGD